MEEGNKRNSKDIKYLLNGYSKDIKDSLEAIEALIDTKNIQLHRIDKYIHISNMELNDQDFKYISKIRFNQLKEIDISENKICLNSACDDEATFNRKFFKNSHYNGFFSDILNHKPIYNGKNLQKSDCGFLQNLSDNFIQYKFCNNLVEFADTKNKIKIKLKEID